jgi:hypothetical protein
MLASTCSMRLATLATVKFLSRLLTALNLLPSIAMTARLNSLNWRHNTTNCAQAARIAGPLSRRKSAIVLKSGISRPVSHISSMLRWVSRSRRRLDWMRLR